MDPSLTKYYSNTYEMLSNVIPWYYNIDVKIINHQHVVFVIRVNSWVSLGLYIFIFSQDKIHIKYCDGILEISDNIYNYLEKDQLEYV